MNIKHEILEINDEDPFRYCKLERKKYADSLTQIVSKYKQGFVLAINNEWGGGKTTFVKMWQKQLQTNGLTTLYFNAWENDFEKDPMIAIMSELKSLIKSDNPAFKSLIKKGAVITKNVLPQLLKALLAKYVDTQSILEMIENTTKASSEILEEEIKEYTNKKKGIKEFKIELTSFIKELKNDNPVIFIIDELDRCRPNYSVELLEQLKHLFSVPGIVFVLAIDKIQLGHAIQGFYGSEKINSDEYLRRFIDLEYTIPYPSTKVFCKYLYDYFKLNEFFHSEARKQFKQFENDADSFIRMASTVFEKANLTLRQQEKIFAHAKVGLLMVSKDTYLFPELYLLLIFSKHYYRDFYSKLVFLRNSTQEIIDEFSKIIPKDLDSNKLRIFIYQQALLAVFYNNSLESYKALVTKENADAQHSTVVSSSLDSSVNNTLFSEFLKSIYQNYTFNDSKIDYILNKIELTVPLELY